MTDSGRVPGTAAGDRHPWEAQQPEGAQRLDPAGLRRGAVPEIHVDGGADCRRVARQHEKSRSCQAALRRARVEAALDKQKTERQFTIVP